MSVTVYVIMLVYVSDNVNVQDESKKVTPKSFAYISTCGLSLQTKIYPVICHSHPLRAMLKI